MALVIMTDPDYTDTTWCRQTVSGLLAEAGRKRRPHRFVPGDPAAWPDWDAVFDGNRRILVVIGTSVAWVQELLSRLSRENIQVVLVSLQSPAGTCGISTVLMDHERATHALLTYLSGLGRQGIALCGINPNSSADRLKESAFLAFWPESDQKAVQKRIYYNYASISACCDRFCCQLQPPCDAVICANDVVAIALIRQLEERGISVPRDLLLASFGGTLLGRLNRIPLTTASLDHNELGRQAFAACQYLEDNPSVLSVSVKVGCQLVIRASTGDLTPQTGDGSFGQSETLTVAPIDFYDDPDVQDILAMESFIGRCDELDLQILAGLLRHQTYAALAEHLFLAENALKYRLRRMLDWLGLANRQMLLEHLSAYLSAASLQEAVRIKLGERS